MNQKKERKKAIKRSPGYPMISLDEAINRAHILWEQDKSNPIHIDTVYDHLGYKHKGGYGARIIAALKKFDLISESKGYIVLTENAIDIMLNEPTNENYIKTVKKIALKPDIYKLLYNEYGGGLPSDATLRIRLIKEHGFNPEKTDGFLSTFRRTISFARLTEREEAKEDRGEIKVGGGTITNSLVEREQMAGSNIQSFNIPLFGNKKAKLIIEGSPIEKEDLDFLKQFIDLMAKPLTQKKKESE